MTEPEDVFKIPPIRYDSDPLNWQTLSETQDWSVKSLAAPESWRESMGEGVLVCVCDTGKPDHTDLPKMEFSYDFTGSRSHSDRHGHATHCCGSVGARRNDQGVVGMAPRCKLATCKVLSDSGSGSSSGIARGIIRAVDAGADVINLSLGGGYSEQVDEACDYAAEHRVFVIAAAGNAGYAGRNTIGFPGRNPNTICVASYNKAGKISNFSSGGKQIDVAGPGEQVLSTYPGNQYRVMSGTSMATPNIAGLVALVVSAKRQGEDIKLDNVNDLRSLFQDFTRDLGPSGHDNRWGWGIPKTTDLIDHVENDDPYYWL